MSDSEVFREVEEEIRREQMRKLWDRYGTIVLAGALLIIVGVAGYKGWEYFQAERAGRFGTEFGKAVDLVRAKKTDEATLALDTLAKEAPAGYRSLARLNLASLAAEQGRTVEAQAIYDAISKDPTIDRSLQDFARVRAASLMIDTADFTEVQNRLNDLNAIDGAWRHAARELMGYSAFRAGKLDMAEKLFTEVIGDPGAPQGLRRRAEMMLSLIVAAQAKPTTG
jgi:hypothetical protein